MLNIFVAGCMPKVVTACVFGNEQDGSKSESDNTLPKPERTFAENARILVFCFIGLQVGD